MPSSNGRKPKAGPWQLKADGKRVESRTEFFLVIAVAGISLAALLWYYAHNELLLYGDAVAHINIARRVIDNRSWLSSFFQLGTVWLPLQHVAMLPFIWNDVLWQSGIAGSIPSMVAYVLGGLGIFRLVSGVAPAFSQKQKKSGVPAVLTPTLRQNQAQDRAPSFRLLPACIATAIYALNPNLLYMQSTAMNEPIFLAFFVWSLVYVDELLDAVDRFATSEGPRNIRAEQASRSPAEPGHATTAGLLRRSSDRSLFSSQFAGGDEKGNARAAGGWRSRSSSFCC